MAYTGDPANSPTDRVRLNIGDTDLYDEGLSDAIYNYLLTKNGDNEAQTSLEALKMLVYKYANYIDEITGEISLKYSQKYNQYKALLDRSLKDPTFSLLASGDPYAGGISLTDRINNPSSCPFTLGVY